MVFAAANTSGATPGPGAIAVMPTPTAKGVLGIVRITGCPGKNPTILAMGTDPIIDTITASGAIARANSSDRTESAICGLMAIITISASRTASRLSVTPVTP